MTMTCDKFLETVKSLVTVPSNQSLLEDEEILALADFENRNTVTPLMESLNQKYFVTRSQKYPVLANKTFYAIPSRAVGRKLQSISLMDKGGQFWSFPMINAQTGEWYQNGQIPFGFRFEGDRIVMSPVPTSDQGYSIQYAFSATPGSFVKLSKAGVITSISGNDITVENLPTTFQANRRIDVINGEPGNWFKGLSLKLTNVASNTVTVEDGLIPEDISEGDFITITGESPVIQLPEEGIPLLLNATSRRILAAISDFEAKADIEKEIKEQKETVARLLQPRVNDKPIRLVNPYGSGRGRSVRRNMGSFFRD